MTDTNRQAAGRNRFRGMRRKLSLFLRKKVFRPACWLFGIFLVIWLGGYVFVRPLAASHISRLCNGAAVYIESGRCKGLMGIRLKGVVITEPEQAPADAPIAVFDEVEATFDPWKLLRGKVEVTSVRVSDFLFNATHDAQHGWNFLSLVRPSTEPETASGRVRLVEIENGAVAIVQRIDGRPRQITTISLNGQIAADSDQRRYHFSLSADGRFGYAGSALSGTLTVGENGEKNRLGIEGRILMPNTKVFDNSWDLEAIRLDCSFDRQAVALRRCGFRLGDSRFDAEGAVQFLPENQTALDLRLHAEQFCFSDHHAKNTFVYSRPVLERLGPKAAGFLTRFHPAGGADIRLSVKGPLEDLSGTAITGTVAGRDMTFRDAAFPYRLEQVRGTAVFSGRDLSFEGVTAVHQDSRFLIDGHVQNLGPQAAADIRLSSADLRFDEDLYNALNEPLKKAWHSFSPNGTTGVDLQFKRYADGRQDLTLVLDFKQAGLTYEHFPYPLENLTGRVRLEPDRVELDDIVSHYDDGRRVRLNGKVLEIGSPQPAFEIHVQAEQIPVDDLLFDSMPTGQRAFMNALDLESAAADIEVDVFSNPDPGRHWDYTAAIELNGHRLEYAGFPLPLEAVRLRAQVTRDIIRLRHFEGTTSGGRVVLSGLLTPRGAEADRPGACLEVGLENFDLNDVFWEAAGDKADRLLGKLRAAGRLDVSGHVAMNLSGPACSPTDLVVHCSDNPVLWDDAELGRISGRLHITEDAVGFEAFELENARLEAVPGDFLHGRLETLYADIRPQGTVQVRIDEGTVRLGADGPEQADLRGGITLNHAAAGDGQIFHDIIGTVDGRLEWDGAEDSWRTLGSCRLSQAYYRDWLIADCNGNLAYDPNTRHFEGTNFTAAFYGGRLHGDVDVDLSSGQQSVYRLDLAAEDIDLPQLAAAGHTDVPGRILQGQAAGALSLAGDLRDPAQLQGDASVKVINMKLGRQSTLGKLLTAVQFKQPEEHVFSELTAQARIHPSQMEIRDIRMVGKPLIFRGKGTLDFSEKQIALDWVAYDRLMGSEDTILDLLARGIGSAIWKVEVRGDIHEPQVEAVFLSVLKQPLNLFGNRGG